MTETLPIVIYPNIELIDRFNKIKSVCNKLEAQFNFQTLTAGWYGDEENVLNIQLYLETPEGFAFQQTQQHLGEFYAFADDVVSYYDHDEFQVTCLIAITSSELDLLMTQTKLLAGFIQAKVHKVLNLIAEQQKLFPL